MSLFSNNTRDILEIKEGKILLCNNISYYDTYNKRRIIKELLQTPFYKPSFDFTISYIDINNLPPNVSDPSYNPVTDQINDNDVFLTFDNNINYNNINDIITSLGNIINNALTPSPLGSNSISLQLNSNNKIEFLTNDTSFNYYIKDSNLFKILGFDSSQYENTRIQITNNPIDATGENHIKFINTPLCGIKLSL